MTDQKELSIFSRNTSGYKKVCNFAKRVYAEKLDFNLNHFPEVFISVHDRNRIYGCIGLNVEVESILFTENPSFNSAQTALPVNTHCCEQSVLVIDGLSRMLPLLIATAAHLAGIYGAQKVAFAGICASMHAIEKIGCAVEEVGPVTLDMMPSAQRVNYEKWHQENEPNIYLLDTKSATMAYLRALMKYGRNVQPCSVLAPKKDKQLLVA